MEPLYVYILVPPKKSYSYNTELDNLKLLKKELEVVWGEAMRGNIYTAITLNGILHSLIFGYGIEETIDALKAGAIAAGLSGTGPAIVALSRKPLPELMDLWGKYEAKIIQTRTNNKRAYVVEENTER